MGEVAEDGGAGCRRADPATIGALSALHHRERTGEGQVVDAAIAEAVFSLMESSLAEHGRLGVVRERLGNVLPKVDPPMSTRPRMATR